ncbi:YbcC family protein [Ekhidna sp.]|uniref:YbcC family protein n=1 Tax=Ekhidna sp. TaxID=2608089 RepID=UPI003B5BC9DD
MINAQVATNQIEIREALKKGTSKVAPLWSLENFVAVNPYLGMSDMKFGKAMGFLQRSGKIQSTLPVGFYLDAIRKGRIIREDIAKALEYDNYGIKKDANKFIHHLHTIETSSDEFHVKTVADVASELNGKKWHRFMIDRISFWATAYFDNKQAIWDTAGTNTSLFEAWKKEAEVDFAPEAMGLKGFRGLVRSFSNNHLEAAGRALEILEINDESLEYYLSSLLLKMNGWAGFAARIDWETKLNGKEGQSLEEFLAVMLVWEVCLKELLVYPQMDYAWLQARLETEKNITKPEFSEAFATRLILQEAFDIANQRAIIEKINSQRALPGTKEKTDVQAVFCIDVRSELFRRNLEAANERIETLGFAGFFAFPIKYVPLAYDEGMNQCPVLLSPSHTIKESAAEEQKVINKRSLQAQVGVAWKSIKKGAISCFSFVSPLGLFFLPKLLSDALGLSRPVAHPDNHGLSKSEVEDKTIRLTQENWKDQVAGISLNDRIKMAASTLKAMSLTENFAPIVLIVGHGSSTVNNPHATGLDCGACGGHSGEANAKVAAAVLNDPEVRIALRKMDIEIPGRTNFIPALHDTTTDNVTLFKTDDFLSQNGHIMDELKYALKLAGEASRKERASRMGISNGDIEKQILKRSKDWSQVRPEWGLAGCSSFIVAPRERTSQLNFGAKAFMHNYSWKKDKDFSVLELIMTAPMVVTSWINLQYFASTVDNKKFGSGNKTLHNVVGGVGVLEGFAGDLRVGLPWQSVHDGENYQHEPQRLNVIIEAPVDEMSKILEKHDSIRQLCDNQWIYLFAMNDNGKVAYKYIGNLEWEVIG